MKFFHITYHDAIVYARIVSVQLVITYTTHLLMHAQQKDIENAKRVYIYIASPSSSLIDTHKTAK